VKGRGAGDRSGRERVIAAKKDREASQLECGPRQVRDVAANTRYGAKVSRPALCAALGILTKRDSDIAEVIDLVTHTLEALAQVRVSHRIGAHVHPTPRSAQVHRDADQSDCRHAASCQTQPTKGKGGE
jgi:hypothetical protein